MKHYYLLLTFFLFSLFSLAQVPPNDEIQNALNISSIPFTDVDVNTPFATVASGGVMDGCDLSNYKKVYYRYVPSQDIDVNIRLSNGNIESSFTIVYRSFVDFPTSDSQLYLEDYCGLSTEKTVSLDANEIYYIVVGNPYAVTDVIFSEFIMPSNDEIQNAVNVTDIPFVDLNVPTQFASDDSGGTWSNCDIGNISRVYYRYAPSEDKSVVIDVSNGNSSTRAIVFQSTVSFANFDSDIELAPDSQCVTSTTTQYDFIGGEVYYILVSNDEPSDILFYEEGGDDIINFSDQNLKNALVNGECVVSDEDYDIENYIDTIYPNLPSFGFNLGDVDLNNDGEIQFYEANLVRYLNLSNNEISDLGGIEHFNNLLALDIRINNINNLESLENLDLIHLAANQNDLSVVDFSENDELIVLSCSSENLESVNVTMNPFLRNFVCTSIDVDGFEDGPISAIDLTQNTQLESLHLGFPQLMSLDISNNIDLRYFTWFGQSQFDSIDISNNTNLESLEIQGGFLTSLDLTNNINLRTLVLRDHLLTEIDLSNNVLLDILRVRGLQLSELNLDNNSQITFLDCSHNPLNTLDTSPLSDLEDLDFSSTNISQIDLTSNLELKIVNAYNSILTNLDLSENNDANTVRISGSQFIESLNFRNDNNLNINQNSFLGLHTSNCPNLQTICVDDIGYATANFTDKDPQTIYVEDCSATTIDYNIIQGTLTFDENENGCDGTDTKIPNTLISASDGANTFSTFTNANGEYAIDVVENSYDTTPVGLPVFYAATPNLISNVFTGFGNTEVADFCATIDQTLYDVGITILPISEARPGFNATYQIVFENGGLTVNSGSITFQFDDTKQSFVDAIPTESTSSVNTLTFDYGNLEPFETRTIDITMYTFPPPTVNGDDVLNLMASISLSDADVNPEDNLFNLAQVVVNSYDPNDKQVLQGSEILIEEVDNYLDYIIRFQNTGTASAINVVITDELDNKLDWSTIQPTSSSHEYQTRITNGDFVEFIFENINLPAQQDDDAGSNGFIAFKIKPKSNVEIGDIIDGEAKIYFDFNAPIITNTVTTEIVDVLSVEDVQTVDNSVVIYPNPAHSTLNIKVNNSTIQSIRLFSITGETLLNIKRSVDYINIEEFTSGIYIIEVETDKGISNKRLIKK